MSNVQYRILFVCLGNICRSPLAEGVCRHMVAARGLDVHVDVDSCGTGAWHVDEAPHRESQRVAKKHGISLKGQRARQVARDDLENFDLLVAMDRQNLADLIDHFDEESEKIVCLREYDPKCDSMDVPDPYYGGPDGFNNVFQIVHRSIERMLDEVEKEL